ncbi:MAG: putative hydro-lyase [Betaproteobacteria bacterium]
MNPSPAAFAPLPAFSTGSAVRQAARQGDLSGHTVGLAPGRVQANLVILPRDWAYDFLLFCQRNPRPCPLLAVGDTGNPTLPTLGADLDVRTDLPRYRVWRGGALVDEPTDIRALWQNDWVSFALGCSFSFEQALLAAGLPLRHLACGDNVAMYRTNLPTMAGGRFGGPLVVSMRPMTPAAAIRAVQITSRFPAVHGAPVHWGDPTTIGIADLACPDYGDPVEILPGEVPMFWACGVTPQAALLAARPPIAITHAPGHMLVTDLYNEHLAAF